MTDAPELRIVVDKLWDRVKRQQKTVRTEMTRTEDGNALNRAHRKRHILSVLIMCGQCGAPYAIRNSTYYDGKLLCEVLPDAAML